MVGHAKNETYELIFGNFLIAIGSFLAGIAIQNVELNYLITMGAPIIVGGIILDVRVLRKFSFDLNNVRQSIQNMTNTINQNILDINRTKEEIEDTKNEMDSTKSYLDSTMRDLRVTKEELEKLAMEIIPDNRITNPDLFNRRFEKIENYTMFDIEKQPIIIIYQKLTSNKPSSDFKSIQDLKLVKLLSLVYKLVWYNNTLLKYNGERTKYEPLGKIMIKKNRLYYLSKLKIVESGGEANLILEQKMDSLTSMCYNSMIDSQVMEISSREPDMEVKEHFVKVSEVNKKFKEIFSEINDFLTVKFPENEIEKITNLRYDF